MTRNSKVVFIFFRCDVQVSRKLGWLYSEMIFVQGYIHCDPHPGNVLVHQTSTDTEIVLLDHGLYQVGSIKGASCKTVTLSRLFGGTLSRVLTTPNSR